MSGTNGTSVGEWVDFFMGAGIPARESAHYAQNFHSNRISMEMLLDLNKEYLRDMGITVLGDIIAILKHAKEVQSNMTSRRVLQSSSSAVSRPVLAPQTTKTQPTQPMNNPPRGTLGHGEDHHEDLPTQSNSTVSARLGPPAARRFAEFKRDNVFKRLEDLPENPSEMPSSRSVSMRPPEDSTTHRSVFKRVDQDPSKPNPIEETRPKKKKYIMVRTLPDGSKIRQVVSPDDPILNRVQVMKKVSVPASQHMVSTTRSTVSPSVSLSQSTSSSREPLRKKRKPISPPRDDDSSGSSLRSYQVRRGDEAPLTKRKSIHERLDGGSRLRLEPPRQSESHRASFTQHPKRPDQGSSRMYSDDYRNTMSHRIGRKRSL